VIINALVGLGWSILAGVVMAAFIFAAMYGRTGAIKAIYSGSDIRSAVVRPRLEDSKLAHLGSKCLVICLHRYIFFGSAMQIHDVVCGIVEEQAKSKHVNRATIFVLDFTDVEDIDHTAIGVLSELLDRIFKAEKPEDTIPMMDEDDGADELQGEVTKTEPIAVLFTGLSSNQRKRMARHKLVQALHAPEYRTLAAVSDDSGIPVDQRRCFPTLDLGLEWVEEQLLAKAATTRSKWLKCESFIRLHNLARRMAEGETWLGLLGGDILGEEVHKYVERIEVPKGQKIWNAGDFNTELYLLQQGRISAYAAKNGGWARTQCIRAGCFLNEDALYLDSPQPRMVVAEEDSSLLGLSRASMKLLSNEHPEIALEVQANVLKYAARVRALVAREPNNLYSLSKSIGAVADENGDEENPAGQVIKPEVIKNDEGVGLLDTSSLSHGVRNGRRIAREFSRQLMVNMDSPKVLAPTKSTVRSVATTKAMAETRPFSAIVKYEALDERVKSDWTQFVGDGNFARPDDIMRVWGASVTLQEAQEMIWEADLEDRGGLSFFDFLDCLTMVHPNEFQTPELQLAPAVPGEKPAATFQIDDE